MSNSQPQQERFADLLERMGEQQRRRGIAMRDTAPGHNVFCMLGVTHSELWHSAFLRDLLDPYGSHGQGATFLRPFVSMVAAALNWQCPAIDEWPSPGEWTATCEADRIDIRLSSTRHGWLVFVENKIGADFQYQQMRRYRAILDSKQDEFCRRALILLKRQGSSLEPDIKPHLTLTYERDVGSWLTGCLDAVVATWVRSNLDQYLQVITEWERAMQHGDANEDLKRLLMQPENLRLVLRATSVLYDVQKDLRDRFWRTVEQNLRDGLQATDQDGMWALSTKPAPRVVPAQCYLTPSADANGGDRIQLGVFHEQSGPRLTYGVGFMREQKVPWPEEVNELRARLLKAFGPDVNDNPVWWVFRREASDRPSSEAFLLRIAEDAEAYATTFTSGLLEILRDHGDALLVAGRALTEAA